MFDWHYFDAFFLKANNAVISYYHLDVNKSYKQKWMKQLNNYCLKTNLFLLKAFPV